MRFLAKRYLLITFSGAAIVARFCAMALVWALEAAFVTADLGWVEIAADGRRWRSLTGLKPRPSGLKPEHWREKPLRYTIYRIRLFYLGQVPKHQLRLPYRFLKPQSLSA